MMMMLLLLLLLLLILVLHRNCCCDLQLDFVLLRRGFVLVLEVEVELEWRIVFAVLVLDLDVLPHLEQTYYSVVDVALDVAGDYVFPHLMLESSSITPEGRSLVAFVLRTILLILHSLLNSVRALMLIMMVVKQY